MNLNGVSTAGSSPLIVQLGDEDGIEATGYVSTAIEPNVGNSTSITGFVITGSNFGAGSILYGRIIFELTDAANTWVSQGSLINQSGPRPYISAGSKALSKELTQIKLTTESGADAFDLGALNITYE